jgi:hypothetical protein
MSQEELEAKAAEEKAAEEAKEAADKLAAENQGKNEEEIAEEARLAEIQEQEKAAAAKAAEEHKEKSRLGRRMSAMEERMNDFIDKASQVLTQPQKSIDTELNEDEYLTVKSFNKIMQMHANEAAKGEADKAREDMLYSRSYVKEINNIGDTVEDEEVHLKVMQLITDKTPGAKYNVKSSKDPVAAAQINYNRALRSLSGKTKSKINLKHDPNLPPAGNPTQTKVKTEPEIVLSPEAKEYMRITNTTEKEARELMKK